ncbi:hypothetical protein DPMN_156523 [Dreissena polymorpha]|uniref:Uncharacterized protein n=1 Tax=Dreissena polymorpha TaxID=45954 RepID=A0A9D4JBX7_DREPO|nr:hypothetical protein DPMN_156523 [Dreissena polymorpha]
MSGVGRWDSPIADSTVLEQESRTKTIRQSLRKSTRYLNITIRDRISETVYVKHDDELIPAKPRNRSDAMETTSRRVTYSLEMIGNDQIDAVIEDVYIFVGTKEEDNNPMMNIDVLLTVTGPIPRTGELPGDSLTNAIEHKPADDLHHALYPVNDKVQPGMPSVQIKQPLW